MADSDLHARRRWFQPKAQVSPEKQRERRLVLLVVLPLGLMFFVLVFVAVGGLWERLTDPVFGCLDSGGCWDYERSQCEFEDQSRCQRPAPSR